MRRQDRPWEALESYCRSPAEDPRDGYARLFSSAGYSAARLTWVSGSVESLLVPGAGGGDRITCSLRGGTLGLSAPSIDGTLRALFYFVAGNYRPEVPNEMREPALRGGILGNCPGLLAALDVVDRLARGTLPVLILGETGTGKELFARRVHGSSGRRDRPFIAINCAALPESLLLSDLFGHVRGSFTGADRDRAGIFESALGGTVFLDEIGDLPIVAQGKLLRVLQEGELRRVGESRARKIEVRIVAATHRDLGAMVEEGTFRRDLYYRLRVGCVELPPLRDRGDDVLALGEHFTESRGFRLTAGARTGLTEYHWPGNVRELRNVLEVGMALGEQGVLRSADLHLPQRARRPEGGYHRRVQEFRRQLVEEALRACRGNGAAAARRLGLSRQALSYLRRTLEIA